MSGILVIADRIVTGFDASGRPEILDDAAILVEGQTIAALGPADAVVRAHPAAPQIGGKGRVAIPGLVNAHHHVGLTPFQLGARDQPLELWFPERLAMRDVDPRLDTLYAAFEMVASRVTTVQHLHSRAPGDCDAVLACAGAIIGTYAELGMRASYSFALRDQNRMVYDADEAFVARLPEPLRAPAAAYLSGFWLPLSDQVAVFHALRDRWAGADLIAIQIAPSNLHWLSDAAIESAAAMAEQTGTPMHMHLLETPYQAEYVPQDGRIGARVHRPLWPRRTAADHRARCLDDAGRHRAAGRAGRLPVPQLLVQSQAEEWNRRPQRLPGKRGARRPRHRRGGDQR